MRLRMASAYSMAALMPAWTAGQSSTSSPSVTTTQRDASAFAHAGTAIAHMRAATRRAWATTPSSEPLSARSRTESPPAAPLSSVKSSITHSDEGSASSTRRGSPEFAVQRETAAPSRVVSLPNVLAKDPLYHISEEPCLAGRRRGRKHEMRPPFEGPPYGSCDDPPEHPPSIVLASPSVVHQGLSCVPHLQITGFVAELDIAARR